MVCCSVVLSLLLWLVCLFGLGCCVCVLFSCVLVCAVMCRVGLVCVVLFVFCWGA